ncbi:serine-rich adhesin for platelets [Folsomia candida]|uniref:serine-rich adhesin for platelets n=1 Tax=Folsomia candida TaxID=158441 RepID=UPI0016052653|nr:serine-rich adhesin for platelets [Folsomia candida]XP_035704832.1 serine-rich adhesin for platelets [Folsomia candida]XP_035704833.1 serine-rich adhesin for platelets [Folsomia candida]
MDHKLAPKMEVGSDQGSDQVANYLSSRQSGDTIVVEESFNDKLTPLLDLVNNISGNAYHECQQNEANSRSLDDGFSRQQGFSQRHMESLEDEGGQQMEMEIRIQGAENGDYGDFQFFHHKLSLQQHLGHNEFSGVSSFGLQNGSAEECDDNGTGSSFSENPFVFPDNVMEYGEPQFFPGSCVTGYLETILEETDEEFDEEEGCSGRHWWNANDSDTDTDSVIRVDNQVQQHHNHSQLCNNNNNQSVSSVVPSVTTNSKLKSVDNVEDLSVQSTFRSSASSRPFELEDLHLLDQLDLAFEETLMEPRRRSGFAAFGHQLHLLDQPLEKHVKLFHHDYENDDGRAAFLRDGVVLKRSASHDGERTVFSSEDDFIVPQRKEKVVSEKVENNSVSSSGDRDSKKDGGGESELPLGNVVSKETFGSSLSPSSSDSSEPHEVAEEDFFYSSPGSEEDEEEEVSSSDDSEKAESGGVVLAEFSLAGSGTGGGNNNSFSSGMLFGSGRNRRSLESTTSSSASSSKLKSFRSFDSLNALSGTELLFSKADTFPSFHYIKEDIEPGGGGGGGGSSGPDCNLTSCSTNDVPGVSCPERGGEEESQSLPSHHSSPCYGPGFPPTFHITKTTPSHSSSSTSTASSSSTSTTSGIVHSSENLSEDSGIGPEGTLAGSRRHPIKRSSESFSDEPEQQEDGGEESAKAYIAKSEFALNPLVFSSLSSSSDAGSNSPSINSIPSLNNNESSSVVDFSGKLKEELKGNQGCVTNGESVVTAQPAPHHNYYAEKDVGVVRGGAENVTDEIGTITHNSLSNFHQGKVDASDSLQIESPQPQPSNHKAGPGAFAASIPFETKLLISINDQPTKPAAASSLSSNFSTFECNCSSKTKQECGLHPYSTSSDTTADLRNFTTKVVAGTGGKADEAKDCCTLSPTTGSSSSGSSAELVGIIPDRDSDSLNSLNYHVTPQSASLTNSCVKIDTNLDQRNSKVAETKPLLSFPSAIEKNDSTQHESTRNRTNNCPSLATESHISLHRKNNNGVDAESRTLMNNSQNQDRRVGGGSVVHCQVPYSSEMEIREGVPDEECTTNSFPPPHDYLLPSSSICQGGGSIEMLSSSSHRQQSNDMKDGADHVSSSAVDPPTSKITRPIQRQRSQSESEFECVECAVELDSFVNSEPTTKRQSSSISSPPTTREPICGDTAGGNLAINGESGPVSTLMQSFEQNGMQHQQQLHEDGQKNIVDVANMRSAAPHKLFTSPLLSSHDGGDAHAGQKDHVHANGTSGGSNSIEPTYWPAQVGETSCAGIKNAKISLHHPRSDLLEQDHAHPTNNNVNGEQKSEIAAKLPPPQNEAVGQQIEIKPSRSVNSEYSSSTDVVHQPTVDKVNKSECGVDKHKHSSSSSASVIGRIREGSSDNHAGLVGAVKPIHPMHIGVADVKKFSQLDSSAAPAPVFHLSHQAVGESESESENKKRHSGGKTEEGSILGQSNFGFFGRSSHPKFLASLNSAKKQESLERFGTESVRLPSSSFQSIHSTTDSSELPSYGFPSSHSHFTTHRPNPNNAGSITQLDYEEGDKNHEITEEETTHNNTTTRYDRASGHLHLEDITCGNHPDQFTISLGLHSLGSVAVAPSLPSKRLVFLNERDSLPSGIGTSIATTPASPLSIPNNKVFTKDGFSKRTSSNSNPLNGDDVVADDDSTNSCPVSSSHHPPDVLGVRKTESSSSFSPGSGEVDRTEKGAKHIAMEVDAGRGGDRQSPSGGIPIKTRTYGPRNEVEVVHMSRNSRTPSPAPVPGTNFPLSSSLKQTTQPVTSSSSFGGEDWNDGDQQSGGATSETISSSCPEPPVKAPRTRVHFSPVVSEISWRESYIDQGSEFSGSTEDIVFAAQQQQQLQTGRAESGIVSPSLLSSAASNSESVGNVVNVNSLVRPLEMTDTVHNNKNSPTVGDNPFRQQRQPSPGRGPPILVEKVQMRSSFLQGGDDDDDEEDDDDLERKLTLALHTQQPNRARSPVDEDHLDGDFIMDDGPRKEGMHFTSASSHTTNQLDNNGVLDLYEDVSVAIEPQTNSTLSMMPDLLSQCENAAHAQTHIDVCIEESGAQVNYPSGKPPLKPKPQRKSHSPTPQPVHFSSSSFEIPPPPVGMDEGLQQRQPQQQIFPKMFADDSNGTTFGKFGSSKSDSKNNSSSSLNKKKSSKGFGLGKKSVSGGDLQKEQRDNKEASSTSNKEKETDASKENKTGSGKGNKPGFFERLSKIRLSGSKPKKQKVHPKMDEAVVQPLKAQNAVNFNGSSSNNGTKSSTSSAQQPNKTMPTQPILKKSSQPSTTPVILNYTPSSDFDNEPDESHAAFENILDEIAGIKNIQMRMDKSSSSTPEKRHVSSPPPPKEMRSFAKRKQFYSSGATTTESSTPSPPVSPNGRSMSDLDRKLSQFKEETSKNRVIISKSHPDLELIEDMVRQQSASPEQKIVVTVDSSLSSPKQSKSPEKPESKKSPKKSHMSETGQKNEREWYKLLKSAAEKYYYRGSNKDKDDSKEKDTTKSFTLPRTGIVETDLDTGTSREIEMLDAELVEHGRKLPMFTASTSDITYGTHTGPLTTMASSSPGSSSTTTKARSLTNLSTRLPLSIAPSSSANYDDDDDVDHLAQRELNEFDERAKSYEFLLDDNQKSFSVPPENKLRTEARQLSEHELRIQRSLQRIDVPEWYKKHEAASTNSRTSTPDRPSSGQDLEKSGGTLKLLNRRSEFGSSGGLAGGWAGLSAFKAPSLSSLQNANGGRYSGSLNRSNFIRGRPVTMSATRLSRESLTGSGSASHSPSAYDRCSFTYGMPYAMTRFGQGRMSNNSGTATPTSISESNASANPSYVKKPYLGWRSQERLNAASATAGGTTSDGAPKLSVYLPPEERLAADLLRTRIPIRPPISDRPPLPRPPPRSEKTSLSNTPQQSGNQTRAAGHTTNANSIPPPNFYDTPQQSSSSSSSFILGHGRSSNVHDSIREVTNAINQYVAKGEQAPKPQPRRKSPGRQAIWMESSFVGSKPANNK